MSRTRSKQKVEVYFAGKPITQADTGAVKRFQLQFINEVRALHRLPQVREKQPIPTSGAIA